ncbi:hydroxypyruvate isomerase [Kineosphaera limosa]|uniref:Hydroxypyruvate isomerase n=1 Tax=Kineosphaera limosa NBRC 100340 TaxID=1184609 RepID=K6WU53_9MICO|nr:TIM barrel protein [Kineosphaera limosa]NYD99682.1 hydroxypyruvate isomerase [Kineosphaera limosa]GAB95637.1 hydroxypyruvate isomerase [Kineosphaera limosa NBRC 100340]
MASYTVNCSILLDSVPLLQRPAAAAQAGFTGVEFWWPFATAVPSDAQVDEFVRSIEDAGVQLTGLNFFAGDMPAGDRGLVSWQSRASEFTDNIDVVVGIGERLRCRAFNALYGLRNDECSPQEADELGVENLAAAGRAVQRIGGIVLLEPVSGAEQYPLKTAAETFAIIDRVRGAGVDNVRFLADFYHLAVNGDDVAAVVADHAADFGHIQIADAPGRGEPGTGDLPLAQWIADSRTGGYDGWIGLEYKTAAADPFAWLPRDQRDQPA